MNWKFFIRRNQTTFMITFFIIILYFIFHYILSSLIEKHILVTIFILILLFTLFPLKEYLTSQKFVTPNWDYLIHSEFHHFEFLAKFFTLEDLIHQVTPGLMIWLKVPDARLFILNPDKKNYTMYVYYKGKIDNIRLIPKKRIHYVSKMIRRLNRIIHISDHFLSKEEIHILKKFNVHILVPFFHLNRLMGFITFHESTHNRYANRALELFAIKSAFLIHDEILRKRIQNIAQYEEELKIAEKIRQMLQTYHPPKIPNYKIQLQNIQTASLIEFFEYQSYHFIIILSVPKINGISGMILSSKLGYLFAYLHHHQNQIQIADLLSSLNTKGDFHHENYPVEILILEIKSGENYLTFYTENNQQYYLRKQKNKFYRISNNNRIYLNEKEFYELYYRNHCLLSLVYGKEKQYEELL